MEEKPTEEERQEQYRKDFEELPLQKKIASLVELESIALSETLSFIINSPQKLVSMAMDVLAEMGLKLEDDAKKQNRPEEHHNGDGEPSVKEETQEATEPSVKEETIVEAVEPSVTEATEEPSEPSVKEETEEAAEPSVKEKKDEKNAPPSV